MSRLSIEVEEELLQRANRVFTYGDRKQVLIPLVEKILELLESNPDKKVLIIQALACGAADFTFDEKYLPLLGELNGPISYTQAEHLNDAER